MPEPETKLIVKVGGSLYDMVDLGPKLRAWLKTRAEKTILIVPGGGPTANIIRQVDRVHHLGEEAAHWLALRALTLNAHWLKQLIPAAVVAAFPIPYRVCILDAYAFAREDDNHPGALPHTWNATSDSLAARVAVVSCASHLILLKSVDVPKDINWELASQSGLVDPVFPSVLRQADPSLHVSAINFRTWQPDSPSVKAVSTAGPFPR